MAGLEQVSARRAPEDEGVRAGLAAKAPARGKRRRRERAPASSKLAQRTKAQRRTDREPPAWRRRRGGSPRYDVRLTPGGRTANPGA